MFSHLYHHHSTFSVHLVYILIIPLTSPLLTILAGRGAAVVFPDGCGSCVGRAQADARLRALVSGTEGLGDSSSAPAESPAVPGAQLTPTRPQIPLRLVFRFSLG